LALDLCIETCGLEELAIFFLPENQLTGKLAWELYKINVVAKGIWRCSLLNFWCKWFEKSARI